MSPAAQGIPIANRRIGDFTSTFTGRQFWPLDPRPEEVNLLDIARALSMQCRFGGHMNRFYSVAQHSVLVSEHSEDFAREGLLHDAAEAYLVDVPTPIKKHLHGYATIERRLLEVIGERFGVPLLTYLPTCVHEADAQALATEQRDLRAPLNFWKPLAAPWLERIESWSPDTAYARFLRRAHTLGLR